MSQITEVSIDYSRLVGSDYLILTYKCDECGKIEKELHTDFKDNYHELADLAIGNHLKLHSYSKLGEKFEDIIKIINGIRNE